MSTRSIDATPLAGERPYADHEPMPSSPTHDDRPHARVAADVALVGRLFRSDPTAAIQAFASSCRRWRWDAAWPAFSAATQAHGVLDLVRRDPLVRHAFEKPRGYPGDAELLDYIYDHDGKWDRARRGCDRIGRAVTEFVWHTPTCESVRWRRRHLARRITETIDRGGSVLSVAAGHMRELDTVPIRPRDAVTAIDQDGASLAAIARSHPSVRTRRIDVRRLVVGGGADTPPADFVYTAGLLDYLDERTATRTLRCLWDMTAPGGTLLVGNFAPYPVMKGFMELVCDWHLICRDESDMERIGRSATEHDAPAQGLSTYRDAQGEVIYLECTRNPA